MLCVIYETHCSPSMNNIIPDEFLCDEMACVSKGMFEEVLLPLMGVRHAKPLVTTNAVPMDHPWSIKKAEGMDLERVIWKGGWEDPQEKAFGDALMVLHQRYENFKKNIFPSISKDPWIRLLITECFCLAARISRISHQESIHFLFPIYWNISPADDLNEGNYTWLDGDDMHITLPANTVTVEACPSYCESFFGVVETFYDDERAFPNVIILPDELAMPYVIKFTFGRRYDPGQPSFYY